MELNYKQCGEYLIPDIKLLHEETISLGKYGRLRRDYLKKNAPFLYSDLLLAEQLYPHLQEIDEAARKRMELMQENLLSQNPAPDKATHQIEWVQHMNMIKAQAEEFIFDELIYC